MISCGLALDEAANDRLPETVRRALLEPGGLGRGAEPNREAARLPGLSARGDHEHEPIARHMASDCHSFGCTGTSTRTPVECFVFCGVHRIRPSRPVCCQPKPIASPRRAPV